MKINRFMFIFICLLVGAGTAGCGPRPEGPKPPSQSSAGLVEKLTVEQLAARADFVLVSKVTHIACYQEGEGSIYTLVTLAVEQTIKGETKEVVNIRVAGGELNRQTLWVEDTPSFQIGERAVVFLGERGGVLSVVGGFQGKFAIDKNNMVSGDTLLSEFIDQIRYALARL